jgi:predicted ABC-type ATPase
MQQRLIVVAGPNGSCKTTITEQLLRHSWMHGCLYINPDLMAQQQFGGWNDPAASKQAADLATEQRENALADRIDVAFKTVFSAPDKLDFLLRARRAGYFVRLFFVGAHSATINAARVAQRMLSGGQEVPIRKIVERYSSMVGRPTSALDLAAQIQPSNSPNPSITASAPQLCRSGVSPKKP